MEVESLRTENLKLREKIDLDAKYIRNLEEAIRLLRYQKFAAKSEKYENPDQLVFNEFEQLNTEPKESEDESEDTIEVGPHKRKKGRKPLPKDLPREVKEIKLPDSERICPHDGTEMKVMGYESSERIDVVPMSIKVIETRTFKYACPCCDAMAGAKPELSIVPKGLPTAGTLSFIVTSKYVDGLSLYHLEKIFDRAGVEMHRGPMANWVIKASEAAHPLFNLLEEDLLARTYLQIDETPVQVLKEKGKKPESKSYMWVRGSPDKQKPIVLFDYDPTRSGKVAKHLLSEFKGKMHCDGYVGYDGVESRFIVRIGCWAHGRRKLFEATKAAKEAGLAKHLLKLVQKLFKVEEEIADADYDLRLKTRREKSAPLVQEIRDCIDRNIRKIPPKSPTGKALQYLHNEWPYLERFLSDAEVHISTNWIENKIRPFAIGRKRWLFCDTVAGAEASAILYSLVETAKANKLNPYDYLKFIFEQLPKAQSVEDFERLLPWNVKKQMSTH